MKHRDLPFFYDILVTRVHDVLAAWGIQQEHLAWVGLLLGGALVLTAMVLLSKLLNWA